MADQAARDMIAQRGGFLFSRFKFDLALGAGEKRDGSWNHKVDEAAKVAGGEMLFILPLPHDAREQRETAVVRLEEDGSEMLLFVHEVEDSLVVRTEAEVGRETAAFAQAFIEVLSCLVQDVAFTTHPERTWH